MVLFLLSPLFWVVLSYSLSAVTTSSQTILHMYAVYMLLCMSTSPFRPPLVSLKVRLQYWKLALEERGWNALQWKSMKRNWHLSSRCVSVVNKACHIWMRILDKVHRIWQWARTSNVMINWVVFDSITVNSELPTFHSSLVEKLAINLE